MTKQHSSFIPENDGVHLHGLIERTTCDRHGVPAGTPCHVLPNNVDPQTDYVAACGSRIKKAGYNGRISAQSMRAEAPRKAGAGKRTVKKKPHARPANGRGKN